MKKQNVHEAFATFVLNTYRRVGPVFVKGKGSYLWDNKGNRYLDLFPGWGVSILGHCHPGIVRRATQQLKTLIHLPNNLYFTAQADLARVIVENSFPAKVFFANSGAEAIEGAIKISRLFGSPTGRFEIITMKNSFHGRTFGAMSATAQAKYKKPFEPILPGFKEASFNDLESFKGQVTAQTVGVLLELVQGEGGVNIADKGYAQQLERYCREHNLLFMVDEVQSGMARTGKLFAFQHYGITPDIFVLSKGLGAGVPISAIVVKDTLAGLMQPGLHASTFGGNPFVTRVGLEVFSIIKKEKILPHVVAMGKYLKDKLCALQKKYSCIKEVRCIGLMAGVELNIPSFPIFTRALEKKLIINSTHDTVLRIMPALTVTKKELDEGLKILEQALKESNAKS